MYVVQISVKVQHATVTAVVKYHDLITASCACFYTAVALRMVLTVKYVSTMFCNGDIVFVKNSETKKAHSLTCLSTFALHAFHLVFRLAAPPAG